MATLKDQIALKKSQLAAFDGMPTGRREHVCTILTQEIAALEKQERDQATFDAKRAAAAEVVSSRLAPRGGKVTVDGLLAYIAETETLAQSYETLPVKSFETGPSAEKWAIRPGVTEEDIRQAYESRAAGLGASENSSASMPVPPIVDETAEATEENTRPDNGPEKREDESPNPSDLTPPLTPPAAAPQVPPSA